MFASSQIAHMKLALVPLAKGGNKATSMSRGLNRRQNMSTETLLKRVLLAHQAQLPHDSGAPARPGSCGTLPMVFGAILPRIWLLLRFSSSPGIVQITGKRPTDFGRKVPIFGMSQNPVSPCLLFVLLLHLFVYGGNGKLGLSTTLPRPEWVPSRPSHSLPRKL